MTAGRSMAPRGLARIKIGGSMYDEAEITSAGPVGAIEIGGSISNQSDITLTGSGSIAPHGGWRPHRSFKASVLRPEAWGNVTFHGSFSDDSGMSLSTGSFGM